MTILSTAATLLAKSEPLGDIGPGSGVGPLSNLSSILTPSDITTPANYLSWIISTVIGVMTVVAGLWFIINFMIAAAGMVFSAGNEEAIKNNTKKITQSLLGLIVVISAYALISLIGMILGFDILNLAALLGEL